MLTKDLLRQRANNQNVSYNNTSCVYCKRGAKWVAAAAANFRCRKQRRWQRYDSGSAAVVKKRCMTLQKGCKNFKNVIYSSGLAA